MYSHALFHAKSRSATLTPVRSLSDLAHMVKESEILTGRPGREFVITADDALLSYVVSTSGNGYEFRRVSSDGRITFTQFGSLDCLNSGSIGEAIATDRLFSKPL